MSSPIHFNQRGTNSCKVPQHQRIWLLLFYKDNFRLYQLRVPNKTNLLCIINEFRTAIQYGTRLLASVGIETPATTRPTVQRSVSQDELIPPTFRPPALPHKRSGSLTRLRPPSPCVCSSCYQPNFSVQCPPAPISASLQAVQTTSIFVPSGSFTEGPPITVLDLSHIRPPLSAQTASQLQKAFALRYRISFIFED